MRVGPAIEQELARPGHRADVLRFLLSVDRGAIDEEIAEATGLKLTTAQARRIDLIRDGLVEDSGEKREGDSGKLSRVWKAVPPERELVVIEKVELSFAEKVAAREQLVGTIMQVYEPNEVPDELAKLARWLKFKITIEELKR